MRNRAHCVFLNAWEEHPKGLFVSIDEVQKVTLDEVAAVCEAFQMASRKGCSVILVLAGLPYAYDRIIHHEGCTLMRRGVRERVGLFTWEDTAAAFGDAFGSIEGLKVNSGVIEQLSSASMGHPYLIQLHGYYLVSAINDQTNDRHYEVTHTDAQNVLPLVIDAYERRALRPMVDELNWLEQDYLRAMAQNLDDDRIAWTNKIAQTLNKQQKQLSRTRGAVIRAIASCLHSVRRRKHI